MSQLSSAREPEKRWRYSSVVGYSPDSNDVSTEAKESPLLGTVTRKRLVKADWEDLACALVICEVCRSAVALLVLVVPSCVYKWSINPFTNPNTVYSYSYTWQYAGIVWLALQPQIIDLYLK
jgi:hypothetical protein